MLSKIKTFIKEIRYKRFERRVNKAITLGEKKVVIDGLEIEIKERND